MFISLPEFSKLHKRGAQTIYRMILRGELKTAQMIDKRWYIDSEEPIPTVSRTMQRICKNCGKIFTGGRRAEYCPDCKIIAQRSREKSVAKRKKENESKRLWSFAICPKCKLIYIVKYPCQKYCDNCRAQVARDRAKQYYDRIHNRDIPVESNVSDKDERLEISFSPTPLKYCTCKICGKVFASKRKVSFCSDLCRKEASKQRAAARRLNHK